MGSQAVVDDLQTQAVRFLSLGNVVAARALIRDGLAATPHDTGLLQLLYRCHEALGETDAAETTLQQVWSLPLDVATLDMLMTHALAVADLRRGRALVARAEDTPGIPTWAVARAKARVAQAAGDLPAATAILVEAIEAAPQVTVLRPLLTEILMAGGSAGHARDVLTRLGLPPTNPRKVAAMLDPVERDRA